MPCAQRGNASSRCATVAIVLALAADEPIFQATNAAIDRAPVAPHNSSRSSSATISTMRPSIAVALTDQLRQLVEQHVNTLGRAHYRGARRCGRGHDVIIAATYDKSGLPDPRRGVPSSSAKRCSAAARPPLVRAHQDPARPDQPPTAQQPHPSARPTRLQAANPGSPNRKATGQPAATTANCEPSQDSVDG